MKTRWYFIIAGAAVVGFATWYQDYDRQDTVRRQRVAAELARAREVEHAGQLQRKIEAAETARQSAEARRIEREARTRRQAAEQAQREEWQSALAAAREENTALRAQRDRLARAIEDGTARLARTESEHAGIMRETTFLFGYINQARDSVARLGVVVEKVVSLRHAAEIDAADAITAPNRRSP